MEPVWRRGGFIAVRWLGGGLESRDPRQPPGTGGREGRRPRAVGSCPPPRLAATVGPPALGGCRETLLRGGFARALPQSARLGRALLCRRALLRDVGALTIHTARSGL